MLGLCGQNPGRSRDDGRSRQQAGAASVGRDADVLKDSGKYQKIILRIEAETKSIQIDVWAWRWLQNRARCAEA